MTDTELSTDTFARQVHTVAQTVEGLFNGSNGNGQEDKVGFVMIAFQRDTGRTSMVSNNIERHEKIRALLDAIAQLQKETK